MDSPPETGRGLATMPIEGAPPALAGRYELGELLGTGASARVYRAEDLLLRRQVAVKLYPAEVAEPDRVRRQRELSVLAQLNHPHLVKLLDAGEDAGRTYLVMELVSGPNLSRRLREAGPMPAAQVARLGGAVADALGYVHQRGVTHRDVKPGNVLLGERPMLTDFGIARLIDTARITQTGYLIGTPAYLAPEQVTGDRAGEPADVYSLGLTLLEALTGRREFKGSGPGAAFARLSRRPAVPGGLPGLSGLLRDMTDPDPARRPTAPTAAAALWRAAAAGEYPVPGSEPAADGSEYLAGGSEYLAGGPADTAPAQLGTRVLPIRTTEAGAGAGPRPRSRPVDSWLRRRKRLVVALVALMAAGAGAAYATVHAPGQPDVAPSTAPVQPAPAKPRSTPAPERAATGDDSRRSEERSGRDESSRRSGSDGGERNRSESNRSESNRSESSGGEENGSGSSSGDSGDSSSSGGGSGSGGSSSGGGLLPIG
jgi:tRNA A-37 threonylcarbamoyl transferase component Bud32